MASEPIGGEGDVVKEKQRFTEYKVYTRKVFKGSRKNPTINTGAEINAAIATGHPAAPASKEPAAPAPVEPAAPAPEEPAAPAPEEPACPAEPASKEPAASAPEEPACPAAPASKEPAAPAPVEPAAPTPEEPAAPAPIEPAAPTPEEPAAPTPEEPACPAVPAPDEPVAPTPEEPACPAVPAPNEHVVPSPDHSACPTPSNPPDTTPAPNPNGPPAPPPDVLAIPSPEDPAATTNFADPSNTVVTGTDDRKNVEGNCTGNNNITPGSINNNANDDHNSNKALEPVTEDVNLTTLQPVTSSGTVCDDSSRLNRQRDAVEVAGPRPQDLPLGNSPVNMVVENQTKVNSASRSKQDTRELRQKLETELGIVRSWVKRIEEKQGQLSGYGPSHASKERVDDNAGSAKIARSEVASVGIPREVSRPFHQLRLSVLDHSLGLGDSIEKEKRTPKANQFYRNSEFLLAKDKFPPAESNKKSKSNGKKLSGELGLGFLMGSKFFKSCSSLLEKLMKHKHGWVFNTPVDVEGLGLLDYFVIIKHPMDLGTVKMRLTKNWYKSPKEFAEDVRLTFRNAMTYNPKGQDVHIMAEQLSKIFEERWVIIESDYNREMRLGLDYGVALSTPTSRKAHPPRPNPLDMRRILDRSESMSHPVDSMLKAITLTPSSRTPAPKKPKAKDPDKRDMTYEEKQKLSTKLQSLPLERLDAVVQIIKKRNSALFQNDEEIEVDIDSVDAETLWELDRFVTNYKKSLSKKKRKAELAIQASQARANSEHEVPGKTLAPAMSDATKENKADQNAVSSVSAFQGEKQGDNRGRSSSSSSSSSDSETSSSDSDSESSSASGSDTGSPRT